MAGQLANVNSMKHLDNFVLFCYYTCLVVSKLANPLQRKISCKGFVICFPSIGLKLAKGVVASQVPYQHCQLICAINVFDFYR